MFAVSWKSRMCVTTSFSLGETVIMIVESYGCSTFWSGPGILIWLQLVFFFLSDKIILAWMRPLTYLLMDAFTQGHNSGSYILRKDERGASSKYLKVLLCVCTLWDSFVLAWNLTLISEWSEDSNGCGSSAKHFSGQDVSEKRKSLAWCTLVSEYEWAYQLPRSEPTQ